MIPAAPSWLVLGTAPLSTFFWGNDAATAEATVHAALAHGVRCFDTAPLYGLGEAEERLGAALRDAGPGWSVTVATKVGRLVVGSGAERDVVVDFSREGTLRSLEDSLRRLGRDRVEIVHVHDPEDHLDAALRHCLPTLVDLRDQGVVDQISVGSMHVATVARFVRTGALDLAMIANRLTLLDRSALEDGLVDLCADARVPLWAAGVFQSGLLARPHEGAWFDYAPAPPDQLARARDLADRCAAAGVSLRAAAMSFPVAVAGVDRVVVGMATPEEVAANVADAAVAPPADVFGSLMAP